MGPAYVLEGWKSRFLRLRFARLKVQQNIAARMTPVRYGISIDECEPGIPGDGNRCVGKRYRRAPRKSHRAQVCNTLCHLGRSQLSIQNRYQLFIASRHRNDIPLELPDACLLFYRTVSVREISTVPRYPYGETKRECEAPRSHLFRPRGTKRSRGDVSDDLLFTAGFSPDQGFRMPLKILGKRIERYQRTTQFRQRLMEIGLERRIL